MKSPHTQRPDADARELTEAFIAQYAGKGGPGTEPTGSEPKAAPTSAN
jgi:hypothetical protein